MDCRLGLKRSVNTSSMSVICRNGVSVTGKQRTNAREGRRAFNANVTRKSQNKAQAVRGPGEGCDRSGMLRKVKCGKQGQGSLTLNAPWS